MELADETARTRYPVERDYVRSHWLLGAARSINGHPDKAEHHLDEALTRCRGINLIETEADILLDLARFHADIGSTEQALRLANEALIITQRCEYVLQGADANLFLADMALKTGDTATALTHARTAKDLAYCDGPPDHTYKVAYCEAEKLIGELCRKQE